ncbi:DUF5391 domain-containing protein [Bacillus aquiflavi]|nr:DUF5391 domain-containing protein [Bacillus aquiflavi]
MDTKKKMIIITFISALLFCTLIVVTSLSPLSQFGQKGKSI